MKIGLNKVCLMGNITRSPELRYTMNKKAFVQITVACNYSKRTEGVYETAADFIPCVAWGKLAETIANYIHKGSPIYLEGKIKIHAYDNKNGEKRYMTEVLIDLIRFIGEPRKDVVSQDYIGDEIPAEENNEELSEADLPY